MANQKLTQLTESSIPSYDDLLYMVVNPGGSPASRKVVLQNFRVMSSVKDFGVVGDGVADDTSAINEALQAGGLVAFPPGTYRITDDLWLHDGTTVWGAGIGRSMIHVDSAQPVMIFRNFDTPLRNVTLAGLTLEHNGLLEWTNIGVIATQSVGLTVENVEFIDCQSGVTTGGTAGFLSSRLRVRDCFFRGSIIVPAIGVHSYNVENVKMVGNTFDAIARPMSVEIDGDFHPEFLWFIDNEVRDGDTADISASNTYNGIQLELEDTCTVTDVVIRGNQFRDNDGGPDIYTDVGCERIIVDGNISSGHIGDFDYRSVFWFDYTKELIVSNNILTNPAGVNHAALRFRGCTDYVYPDNLLLGWDRDVWIQ